MQKRLWTINLWQNGQKTLQKTNNPESARNLLRTSLLRNVPKIPTNSSALKPEIYCESFGFRNKFQSGAACRLAGCMDIFFALKALASAINFTMAQPIVWLHGHPQANLHFDPFPFWQRPCHSRHFHNSGNGSPC